MYTKVSFQEYLYLDVEIDAVLNEQQNENNRVRYELKGCIVHEGSSTNKGHYFTYLKNGSIWELHNDRIVTQKPVEEVFTDENFRKAYLFTFRIADNIQSDL